MFQAETHAAHGRCGPPARRRGEWSRWLCGLAGGLAGGLAVGASAAGATPPPGDALDCRAAPQRSDDVERFERLAPGVWRIRPALERALRPGAAGTPPEELDAAPGNHGEVSNLLMVAQGTRTWLLGSGPDAEHGRALACAIRQVTGRTVTDLIAPWPRPELVLGASAFPGARYWAHEHVIRRLRERCAHCIERLAQRLQRPAVSAASAASPPPAALALRLPDHPLAGTSGRLGPWRWIRLWRTAPRGGEAGADERESTPVTVWALPRTGLAAAHGLLWAWGAPDGRDARLADLAGATAALQDFGRVNGVRFWLPEQGPVLPADAPAVHTRYWQALETAVQAAQQAGSLETSVPTELPGVAPALSHSARHALNWQRLWREQEAR